MIEPSADGGTTPRAFLRVGGLTVARKQLALALALGCERIVCLAAAMSPPLLELQHVAEAAGAKFHVIAGPRALLGLVSTVDELVVLSDGLFASVKEAAALLSDGQAVLVQPIDQGLAAGFERIDIDHASAGAMRLPGRLVERLAELPADCDPVSALQRIALQAGVRQKAIAPAGNGGQFWHLVRSEHEAHAIEPLWVRQRTREMGPLGPSRWLALLGVRSMGAALLHAGSGALPVAVAAALMALFAIGAGWFAHPVVGLILCALGWLVREGVVMLARIEGEGTRLNDTLASKAAYGWFIDALIVALGGWGLALGQGPARTEHYFAPLMLVGLVRILSRLLPARIVAWLDDRAILAGALAAMLFSGAGATLVPLAAVLLLLAGILYPGASTRLTRP